MINLCSPIQSAREKRLRLRCEIRPSGAPRRFHLLATDKNPRADNLRVLHSSRSAEDPARVQFAVATFDSGQFCGSNRRNRVNISVLADALVVDFGNSSCKLAFPGMQIFSQTSQVASAESFTVESLMEAGGVISCISRTSSW